MAAMAQLRYSPLSTNNNRHFSLLTNRDHHLNHNLPTSLSLPISQNPNLRLTIQNPNLHLCFSAGDGGSHGGSHGGAYGGSGGGGGGGNENSGENSSDDSSWEKFGILGLFIKGWQSRVSADPQFPFKVLMEEIVGVSSCVLGDMASRPNFGLNELDFVFCTLIVGSIMNFTLMYLLAPTGGSVSSSLPSIFASCPQSHCFEPGSFSLLERCGTLVYKGTVFAAVGLAAGLVGTAISNGLITMRKKMDPGFETPNKPPPPLLNAVTWALHMGISSNFRYQTLNGLEFVLEKSVAPVVFKSSVIVLRCANNVLGGMSFVALARLTGSQSVDGGSKEAAGVALGDGESSIVEEKEKLVEGVSSNQST